MKKNEIGHSKISQVEDIIKLLSSALRSRLMYPDGHGVVHLSCRRLMHQLSTFFQSDDACVIVLLGGEFVYEKIPLTKVSVLVRNLYRALANCHIESVTFTKGIQAIEISHFINLLLRDKSTWEQQVDPMRMLSSEGIDNISFQTVELTSKVRTVSTQTTNVRVLIRSMKVALKEFFGSLYVDDKPINLDDVIALQKNLIKSIREERFAVISRIHMKHAPDDIVSHSLIVGLLSYLTGQGVGLAPEVCSDLMTAGLLHDIGIMDMPPKSVGRLLRSSEDPKVYLEHPIRGLGILRSIPGVPTLTELVAFEHHMRWDHEGFPRPANKSPMNLASSIVALADTYDKLLHGNHPVPLDEIPARLIGMAGRELEPGLVADFLVEIGVFPLGTYVKLTNDNIGLVVDSTSGDVFRPTVKILAKADGSDCTEDDIINLTERDVTTGGYMTSIKCTLDLGEVEKYLPN